MKSARMLLVVLMLVSGAAFAQSDVQKSFDKLKTLAGSWEGVVHTDPQRAEMEGKAMHISLRATNRSTHTSICSACRNRKQGLKPWKKKRIYRSAEALRHPKSNATQT